MRFINIAVKVKLIALTDRKYSLFANANVLLKLFSSVTLCKSYLNMCYFQNLCQINYFFNVLPAIFLLLSIFSIQA